MHLSARPTQAPVHPLKSEFRSGVARSSTVVPRTKSAVQDARHVSFAGELTTTPRSEPPTSTVSFAVGEGGAEEPEPAAVKAITARAVTVQRRLGFSIGPVAMRRYGRAMRQSPDWRAAR